jgi:holo-[acyl-carrier protein] synthase
MVIGIGLDLVETQRVARLLERYGERFVRKLMDPAEAAALPEDASERALRLALAVAAKEAASKALGTGWSRGVRWRDLEVCRQPSGRPTLVFHGQAGEIAKKLGVARTALSLTHTGAEAIAQVILEN